MTDRINGPTGPKAGPPVTTTGRPMLDFERYPYSGTAENEDWVRNGGSIVNGQRWGWQ